VTSERAGADIEFFAAESARLAALCDEMAQRFQRGGRLLAVGDESDARHVAVEFVHPVIVGKRALPALALPRAALTAEAEPDDIVVAFDNDVTIIDQRFSPPTSDPFVRQELIETLYHVLWELVHVFLEHRETSPVDAGAASFLYPFLGGATDVDAVREDVRRSIEAKAAEIGALRERTLAENALGRVADAIRGARVLALGNGGSATDAMDLVSDLRARGVRALDLTGDPSILTAIANDIGVDAIFARQVIAYGRPGDALLTFSTSGSSGNVIAALAEARRRGLTTVAFVGYDGGRIAAERAADHVIVVRSEHIPRIQEAQASAYHTLVELLCGSAPV
jgi:D-sedoheptulose 7-phosphate isomerase